MQEDMFFLFIWTYLNMRFAWRTHGKGSRVFLSEYISKQLIKDTLFFIVLIHVLYFSRDNKNPYEGK